MLTCRITVSNRKTNLLGKIYYHILQRLQRQQCKNECKIRYNAFQACTLYIVPTNLTSIEKQKLSFENLCNSNEKFFSGNKEDDWSESDYKACLQNRLSCARCITSTTRLKVYPKEKDDSQ